MFTSETSGGPHCQSRDQPRHLTKGREERRKEEEQREVKKEIERGKTGKEMLEYKRKQEEELAKRMFEERNRKVRKKIGQLESVQNIRLHWTVQRATHFPSTQEEVEAANAAALLATQAEMEVKRDASAREGSKVARIQFHLSGGSPFTNQFPSEAPLEEEGEFAAQAVGNVYCNFSLATIIPGKNLPKKCIKGIY